MIELKSVSKSFGNQKILDEISLNIKKGEFISIVGPSGAGKTTLLNIIGTIEDFDKSEKSKFLINSHDITKLSDKDLSKFRNDNIGFVFQFHQLLPELTVEENILLPTMIKVIDRSFSVSFLLRFELFFLVEKTSNPPRFAGKRITKAAIQINPPPNQATKARQRRTGFEYMSFGKTGNPVVVKAPTISR